MFMFISAYSVKKTDSSSIAQGVAKRRRLAKEGRERVLETFTV